MPNKRRKTLLVVSEVALGNVNGVTTTIRHLVRHAPGAGHSVVLAAPKGRVAPPAAIAGAVQGLTILPSRSLPFYPEVRIALPSAGAVRTLLREIRPDLVHTMDPLWLGAIVHRECFRLGIPVVASFHTHVPAYLRYYGGTFLTGPAWRALRAIYRDTAIVLGPSGPVVDELRRHGIQRVVKWGRAVDAERFHPDHRDVQLRRKLSAGKKHVAIYVGRLASEKNVEFLCQTLAGSDSVRLVLVGDGPLKSRLEKRSRTGGYLVAGALSGAQLAAYYASADVFVFASTSETYGQVLNEAMASGLPIVAVKCPVTEEVLTCEPAGKLVGADEREFRDAVEHVLDDGDGYRRRALEIAAGRTWAETMEELFRVYDGLCGDAAVAPRTENYDRGASSLGLTLGASPCTP